MKDRFQNTNHRERMHRCGFEPVDGGLPRELHPLPRRQLSKAKLRAQLAEAMASTPNIKILRVKSRRGAS